MLYHTVFLVPDVQQLGAFGSLVLPVQELFPFVLTPSVRAVAEHG